LDRQDIDPTGRFTFYYPTTRLRRLQRPHVEMYGTHVVDVKGRGATTI
jgi:hypothetical protein